MPNLERIRLLVVEDNQERIDLFNHWMPEDIVPVFAAGAGRAMRIIELDSGNIFGGIALDFDLDGQPIIASESTLSGRDVAIRITQRISADVPILIHSMNLSGELTMRNMFEAFGFSVTRLPFRYLDRETLGQWLNKVREARDET